MRTEESAGGVIINTTKIHTYVLFIKDPKGKWTFPKGLIEEGEKRVQTAEREVAEEVGLTGISYLSDLTPVKYKYRWKGELVDKTVHYFIFSGDREKKLTPQAEEGIQDVQWFEFDEAEKIVGYKKTNRPVLEEVRKLF